MNLKTLLLLKLVCCGGPLLVLALASVGLSGVLTLLAGTTGYLLGGVVAGIIAVLVGPRLWRSRHRAAGSCESQPGAPARVEGF